MIYLTKVLSIDIRDRLVSIAYLGRTFRGIDLIDSGIIPKEPVPISSMKEDNENEENKYDEELLEKLRSFIEEKKFSQEETVMCVPRNAIMFKFITLPSPDEASLSNILKYELDRLIPINPAEVYYDYKVVEKEGSNNFKVLLAAVPIKVIDYYVGLLKCVGLYPTVLNVSTFGSFNTGYFSNYDLSKTVALIDVSVSDFEIIFIENNTIRFSRSIRIAGKEWEECFFNGREFIKDDGRAVEALSENILQNFEKCVDIATEKRGTGPLDKVLFSGGGQSDQILFNFLKQKLDLETNLLIPSQESISIKGDIDETNCLSTAIGLGLGELRKSPMNINLLPHSLRAKRKKSHIILTFILLGLILFSSLGIVASSVIKDRLLLSDIEEKLKTIRKKVVKVEGMELKREEIAAQFAELNRLWGTNFNMLNIIKELTENLPRSTWLSSLSIKKGTVEISGRSLTASSLIPLLDKSPLFKNVRFEGSVEKKDGVEKFKIKMVLE